MKHIKAVGNIPSKGTRVFLAGSIEMGAAVNWQDQVAELLATTDLVLLNPRRDDWDSSWEQKKENAQFREQVEWELQGLEEADQVLIVFDPNTKSPITLMELGFVGGYKDPEKIKVVCPEGFWRKGNVDIFCERNSIPQYESIDAAVSALLREQDGDPA